MNRFTRRTTITATAGLLAAPALRAQAAWPNKDLRLVCPFPPGGTTDVVARLVAAAMRDRLGRNVVVENQPGAGSTLAAGRFAREADDHALFLSQIASHAIGPALFRNLAYDPETDFRAVTLVVTVPNVWVANPRRVPGGDLRAFLRDALAGVRVQHVPYRGAGPAMTAVIGGEVDSLIDNLPTALPQIQNGNVVALAVTSRERLPDLPNVPAVSELGAEFNLVGFEAEAWFGLHAHKSASDAVVARMAEVAQAALNDPAVRQQLAARGTTPRGGPPADYAALVTRERQRWFEVVRQGNVQAD